MPGQSAQGRVPSKRPAKARTSRPSGAGALSTSRSTSVACSSAAGSAVVGATVGGGVAASPGAAASVDGLQPARAIAAASRVVVNRVRFVIECSVGGLSQGKEGVVDRKSVGEGKSVYVSVDVGGRRI